MVDLRSPEPGEYEVVCTIPGHEDSGMEAALTVIGEGEGRLSVGPVDESHVDHSGALTEEDYQRLDEAMSDSITAFPAETEGVGNELFEPTVLDDGTNQDGSLPRECRRGCPTVPTSE